MVALYGKQCGLVGLAPSYLFFGPVDFSKSYYFFANSYKVGPLGLLLSLPSFGLFKAYSPFSLRGLSHCGWLFYAARGLAYTIPYLFMGIPSPWAFLAPLFLPLFLSLFLPSFNLFMGFFAAGPFL